MDTDGRLPTEGITRRRPTKLNPDGLRPDGPRGGVVQDRFPRAALRRHIQIRDRTCTAPGCRAPATGADIDHTVEHSRGGTTTRDDLAPTCRHDHRLKTEGGWTVQQPQPGLFIWTSPLGRAYRVRPEPILPPPAPQTPREQPAWFTEPADDIDRSVDAEPRTPCAPPAPKPTRPHRDPFTLTDPPGPRRPATVLGT